MTTTTPSDHLEVEWQFGVAVLDDAERWLQAANIPGFRVAPGKRKLLEDTYLDTIDWRVHRAGFTCRVREKGDGAELTLKSMAEAQDSMRSRREVNEPIAAANLESAAAAHGHKFAR